MSQLGSCPNLVIVSVIQRGSTGVEVNHMRHHMTGRKVKGGHVIDYVTSLRVNEDYTSQHDLESSKIQHMILKSFREEKANSDKVDYHREVLSGRKLHAFRKVQ